MLSFLALAFIHRIFNPPNRRTDLTFLVVSMMIVGLSHPFHFLFSRGNIDAFVLLLTCAAIFCIGRRNTLAGILLGLAIAAKIYPILLVFPLLARRRWKTLAFVGLTLVILFLLMPETWSDYLIHRLATRGSKFRVTENGSIANTFYFLGLLFKSADFFKDASTYLYIAMFGTVAYVDFKMNRTNDRDFCASLTMYLPFMVSVPQCSFHYAFVCLLALLPVLSWLWEQSNRAVEKRLILLVAAGVGLSQFPAMAAAKSLGAEPIHVLPGIGLFTIIAGITAYKLVVFRQHRTRVRDVF